jgi:hypothetical protein
MRVGQRGIKHRLAFEAAARKKPASGKKVKKISTKLTKLTFLLAKAGYNRLTYRKVAHKEEKSLHDQFDAKQMNEVNPNHKGVMLP